MKKTLLLLILSMFLLLSNTIKSEAFSIPIFQASKSKTEIYAVPSILYTSHCQEIGWTEDVSTGISGTVGETKRLEALKITLKSKGKSMIKYRVRYLNGEWQDWKQSGDVAGTTGCSQPLEALEIKLIDKYKEKYDIHYRVCISAFGWTDWVKNGKTCGSENIGFQIEAIEIKMSPKEKKIDFSSGGAKLLVHPELTYSIHEQDNGWLSAVDDNTITGMAGKRVEAISINVLGFDGKSGVKYRVHTNKGWSEYIYSGGQAGSTGQSLAIDGMQIELTESLSPHFDICYRSFSANGWSDWYRNGAICEGKGGMNIEAVQLKVVRKGVKNELKLVHHMETSLRQGDYSGLVNSRGQNVGCCALAYATGLSIVTGQSHNPEDFWIKGLTHFNAGHIESYQGFDTQVIDEALYNSKPVMLHYFYKNNSGEHWVLIIGKNNNVNSDDIASYIVIDPATGSETSLIASHRFEGGCISGIKVFCE